MYRETGVTTRTASIGCRTNPIIEGMIPPINCLMHGSISATRKTGTIEEEQAITPIGRFSIRIILVLVPRVTKPGRSRTVFSSTVTRGP